MHRLAQVIIAQGVVMSFYVATLAATIGPIPYETVADSPFDLSGLGETFFLEDFSNGVEIISFVTPDGFTEFFGRFSSPGVTVSTGEWWRIGPGSGRLRTFSRVTDRTTRTWLADLTLTFDADALGRLPQAVGFSITSSLPVSIDFYSFDHQLVETLNVPALPPVSLSDGSTQIALRNDRFVGAVYDPGIATVSISSSTKWGLTLDDLQYGRFIPEPSYLTLAALGALLLLTMRGGVHQGRSGPFLAQRY